jgi:pimeloyl-ACP methyl ester carboxylesterase
MPAKTTGSTVRLRDGRSVGYAVYGDPDGRAGFYFHGSPGSRIQARLGDDAGARLGVCIIAVERPGFGLSDFKARRAIADWPRDVVEVADALGIDQFAVMGPSGGGPYVAACAREIPHRLTSAAIVSCFGPIDAPGATDGMIRLNRVFFALTRRVPPLARVAMWWLGRQALRDPGRVLSRMARGAPDRDKSILARPEVMETFRDDIVEAFRQGSRGVALELFLYTCPWGLRLQEISMEVHLWHGEADVIAPPSMGRYLTSVIPNCHGRFYPGEGHLLGVDRMEEIQAALFP